MRKFTQKELDSIIIDYQNGMKPIELADKYERNSASIIGKLKSIGVYNDSKVHLKKNDWDRISLLYSEGDKETIKKEYPNLKWQSVIAKMSKLGVELGNRKWTEDELRFLRDNYYIMTPTEISEYFNGRHTASSVYSKAYKGLGMSRDDDWTSDEIEIILNYYSKVPVSELIDMLPGRSENAIKCRAQILGVKSFFYLSTYWSKEDTDYLINNWKKYTDSEIADALGKDRNSVLERRRRMGFLRVAKDGCNYQDLSKYLRGQSWKWKIASIEACKNRCVITGSNDFEIHHKYCLNQIIADIFEKYDLPKKNFFDYTGDELSVITSVFLEEQDAHGLGVCVRKDIHNLYHSVYGKFRNTNQQWEQFYEDYLSGKYNELKTA